MEEVKSKYLQSTSRSRAQNLLYSALVRKNNSSVGQLQEKYWLLKSVEFC